MDIENFLRHATKDDIVNEITKLLTSEEHRSLMQLCEYLLKPAGDPYTRDLVSAIVPIALLQRGLGGIDELVKAFWETPRFTYKSEIFRALWYASRGKIYFSLSINAWIPQDSPLFTPLSDETIAKADVVIHELMEEATTHGHVFDVILNSLSQTNIFEGIYGQGSEHRTAILKTLTAGTIKISRKLIADFKTLIEKNEVEEVYQKFLKENPVFLEPLASEVISKQKLGLEFITDYVIRRYDGKYLLVEIERPQDEIFTSKNDFTSKFIHAFGQIIDFQSWIESHAEYARSLLPEIYSPTGLLVIGRGENLTKENMRKLHGFAANSKNIRITTFDDLLISGENLYKNIHK